MADLSVASVSRVLNGHNNVNPVTRERVLDAVRVLGYTPNAAARSLSTSRSHAIGVVLPDLHGEFFSELVRGLDKGASERGYLLLLSNMHADPTLAGQAMGAMRGRVDGLIVMAPQMAQDELDQRLPKGLPSVLINSPDSGTHHTLRIDNAAGVRAVVRHLLASGRRHIVHLAGMADNLDAAERRQAYVDAMADFAPDLPTQILDGQFSDGVAHELTTALLSSGLPCDAIFAANDMMALGAMRAVTESGRAVPDDVAIIGFDDIPLARYLNLSTVQVDVVGIGLRAVNRLIDEIEGKVTPPAIELLPTTLMLRTTSGQLPA